MSTATTAEAHAGAHAVAVWWAGGAGRTPIGLWCGATVNPVNDQTDH